MTLTPAQLQGQQLPPVLQQQMELMQRQVGLQERQLALQERAQDGELELRRQALEQAAAAEQRANDRLANADNARMSFAHRGQTFAMWLAAGVTVPLLIIGLVCISLAVAGVGDPTVELAAGGLALAGSLFAGVANLIRGFLPRDHT